MAWEDVDMDRLPSEPADSYALGRSDAETRRLILQHQLYGPFTRQFLTAAGITAGMKVLDVGGGPGWLGFAYVADTVRSLLPFLERMGAVRPEEVDIDTLEERLRAEVTEQDGIQLLPAIVGAWART
jgi:hypothetical protein